MFASLYLERYAYPKQWIDSPPSPDLGIVVIIPCYNEPDCLLPLRSLAICNQPSDSVEVLVVINESENDSFEVSQQNQLGLESISRWSELECPPWLKVHPIYANNLSKKDHGVGLARKIGMDEAIRRFSILNRSNGVLACLDADCTCQENYLTSIESSFQSKNVNGASIFFEHDLNYPDIEDEIRNGIIQYELHLRYYINAQQFSGFYQAFQTVGSCMAVTAKQYCKTGGMNKRTAGEDFYFLQKVIEQGNFINLTNTTVYPSARQSTRVPFGTGRAMVKWKNTSQEAYKSYSPKSFLALKELFQNLNQIYSSNGDFGFINDQVLRKYLASINADKEVSRLIKGSTTYEVFKKHFMSWFNAFRIMKFLHFARENYKDVNVVQAASWLLNMLGFKIETTESEQLLLQFREMDRINAEAYVSE